MKLRSSVPIGVVVIVIGGAAAAADEWPRFRGPNRDNISSDRGLLKKWPKDGPPVTWKATGVGTGYSTVSVAGGRVFTMGNREGCSYVFALDLKDGKQLWSAKVGAAGDNLGCTPTVDGDRVYAIGEAGDLVCLAAAGGRLLWRRNFREDFGGRCGNWGYTESPLVDGDKLVCTPGAADAALVALNKKTGEVIWRAAVPAGDATAGCSSVVIADVGGVRQYVQLLAAGAVGIAARDGTLLWRYEKLAGTANIPTPIVLGDHIFCSVGYRKGGALLKLTATGDGGVTATEVYYNPRLKNKHGGLVVVGDRVYGDHDDGGFPFCADVKSGTVIWEKTGRGPGVGSAAVTYADSHLYFRFDNGVMALVPAAGTEYREVSTFTIPNAKSRSWAHPVVVGGRLYLREQDTVWCYDVKQR